MDEQKALGDREVVAAGRTVESRSVAMLPEAWAKLDALCGPASSPGKWDAPAWKSTCSSCSWRCARSRPKGRGKDQSTLRPPRGVAVRAPAPRWRSARDSGFFQAPEIHRPRPAARLPVGGDDLRRAPEELLPEADGILDPGEFPAVDRSALGSLPVFLSRSGQVGFKQTSAFPFPARRRTLFTLNPNCFHPDFGPPTHSSTSKTFANHANSGDGQLGSITC